MAKRGQREQETAGNVGVCYIHLVRRPRSPAGNARGDSWRGCTASGKLPGPVPQMGLHVFCNRLEEKEEQVYSSPTPLPPRSSVSPILHFPFVQWWPLGHSCRAISRNIPGPFSSALLLLPASYPRPSAIPLCPSFLIHHLPLTPLPFPCIPPLFLLSHSCPPLPLPTLPGPLNPFPYWEHWQVFFSLRSLLI